MICRRGACRRRRRPCRAGPAGWRRAQWVRGPARPRRQPAGPRLPRPGCPSSEDKLGSSCPRTKDKLARIPDQLRVLCRYHRRVGYDEVVVIGVRNAEAGNAPSCSPTKRAANVMARSVLWVRRSSRALGATAGCGAGVAGRAHLLSEASVRDAVSALVGDCRVGLPPAIGTALVVARIALVVRQGS